MERRLRSKRLISSRKILVPGTNRSRLTSPKIPRAKALVRFSRYRAAQEAALEENWTLNKKETGCGLLPGDCERCRLRIGYYNRAWKHAPVGLRRNSRDLGDGTL